jgi:hypothetical protein
MRQRGRQALSDASKENLDYNRDVEAYVKRAAEQCALELKSGIVQGFPTQVSVLTIEGKGGRKAIYPLNEILDHLPDEPIKAGGDKTYTLGRKSIDEVLGLPIAYLTSFEQWLIDDPNFMKPYKDLSKHITNLAFWAVSPDGRRARTHLQVSRLLDGRLVPGKIEFASTEDGCVEIEQTGRVLAEPYFRGWSDAMIERRAAAV